MELGLSRTYLGESYVTDLHLVHKEGGWSHRIGPEMVLNSNTAYSDFIGL